MVTPTTPIPSGRQSDTLRDNSLKTAGWDVLRFTTLQIREELDEYTVPTILKNINRLDGIEEGNLLARRFDVDGSDHLLQSSLFD